jgi:ATP-dependent exoDNAse (exonuclease V) alpha subunit
MARLRGKGTLDAMASYFLLVKTFSRGKGSSTTRAAAYRSGERIRDERSSAVYDYTDRTDVAHAEIVLPAEYAGHTDMEWALNRQVLWNAVQQSGRRWDARLAREVLVHLPPEMTRAQRVALVRRLSHELADRYHSAVDFAVHEPRPQADERHHHAHILMTSRQVEPGGIGARTTLELSGKERHARGLGPSKDDLLWLRQRWAQISNEALHEAGLTVRIDHRSYKDQGINREPKPMMPSVSRLWARRCGRTEFRRRATATLGC